MTYGLLVLFVLMILVMLIVVGPPPAHDLVAYLVWLQITGTTTTERAQAAPFALRLRLVPVQSISLGVQEKPWIGIISYISS